MSNTFAHLHTATFVCCFWGNLIKKKKIECQNLIVYIFSAPAASPPPFHWPKTAFGQFIRSQLSDDEKRTTVFHQRRASTRCGTRRGNSLFEWCNWKSGCSCSMSPIQTHARAHTHARARAHQGKTVKAQRGCGRLKKKKRGGEGKGNKIQV